MVCFSSAAVFNQRFIISVVDNEDYYLGDYHMFLSKILIRTVNVAGK